MAKTKVKNYGRPHRLKKEALKYFSEKLSAKIMNPEDWKKYYNIDENALEEIEMPVITYGVATSENATSLSGWSNPENREIHANKIEGGSFCFTIHFESMKNEEYDRFSKGRMMREFMDRIQREADHYFQQFIKGEIKEED
ncbi:MAG: hypothetical protein IJR71_00445 [Prevotella sp.]|nr:hypothetical protein [Prevotella sp.]